MPMYHVPRKLATWFPSVAEVAGKGARSHPPLLYFPKCPLPLPGTHLGPGPATSHLYPASSTPHSDSREGNPTEAAQSLVGSDPLLQGLGQREGAAHISEEAFLFEAASSL